VVGFSNPSGIGVLVGSDNSQFCLRPPVDGELRSTAPFVCVFRNRFAINGDKLGSVAVQLGWLLSPFTYTGG